MHPRFRGARRIDMACPGGDVEVVVAKGSQLRLRGLMRLEAEEITPLLLPACRSIHTHLMRSAIDVVWLETTPELRGARVLTVAAALEPGGSARAPRSARTRRRDTAALELRPGEAKRLGLTPEAEVAMGPMRR